MSNWYVRTTRAGAGTGADWNNAWAINGIGWERVNAGDTIWLCGGKYSSGMAIPKDKSGTSSSPIRIAKVLASDSAPANSPGWNASFDTQVELPVNGFTIPSNSYLTIDGRAPYGILISFPSSGGIGIEACIGTSARCSHLTFRYIDVNGGYFGQGGKPFGTGNFKAWKVSPGNGTPDQATFTTFEYCRVRGINLGLHLLASDTLVQYCTIQDIWPSVGPDHPDVQYTYPSPRTTWRYNTIINVQCDGLFHEFGGGDDFRFYGNLYYCTTNHMIAFKQGSTYGPFKIYNNVFHGPGTGKYEYGYLTSYGNPLVAGCEVYNNIFFNTQNSITGPNVKSDYNAYNYETLGGYPRPSGEAHSFSFTESPFVKMPAYATPMLDFSGDFHLKPQSEAAFRNGLALAKDGFIDKDMDGIQRGNPWYIGAYQFGGTTPPPDTTPPDVSDGTTISATFGQTKLNVTQAGDYVLSASVIAPSASANSLNIDFETDPIGDDTRCWDMAVNAATSVQEVAWRGTGTPDAAQFAPKVWTLAAGLHTLFISKREENVTIKNVTFKLKAQPPEPPVGELVVAIAISVPAGVRVDVTQTPQ